jgi:hypothetical protein
MPGFSKSTLSLRFPHQNHVGIFPFPICCMPCPSQSSWFDQPNNIWWAVHSIKLFVKFYGLWDKKKNKQELLHYVYIYLTVRVADYKQWRMTTVKQEYVLSGFPKAALWN